MPRLALILFLLLTALAPLPAPAADVVPAVVQQPGTQPGEISNLESPNKCDNCHGGYNSAVEPAWNWRGSMMAHAGRDPIFWATLAIAEQDFDGAGDLCLRCHSTGGWLAGHSTPTDGSGLAAGDSDGVECDYCHKLTNPDDSEYLGVMNPPFVANEKQTGESYYGSGMSSMWGGSDKLGPYGNAEARHQFMPSEFHRDRNFCGTCHDVSNPVTGNLAHNAGAQFTLEPVVRDGSLADPVDGKAAFNNPPYLYGVVERTFSEYWSSAISGILVDEYPTKLASLQGGALQAIYEATWDPARQTANYEDGTPRFYSCQSCHMRAVTGTGANKAGVPVRSDLPLHDMTGGNYWMAEAIIWLDDRGRLRLGGGMSAAQRQALRDGALRAQEQLRLAATLKVEGNEVYVTNHSGHKLITGYPEGRRMWLNVKWYDAAENLLREDGAYGSLGFDIHGQPVQSILDLHDSNTLIFQAEMGMTQAWAAQLLPLLPDDLVLAYNRLNGSPTLTLGQLAGSAPGTTAGTFHFALNNVVVDDNRIPPYGMSYDEAQRRNASPMPPDQYDGAPGGTYDNYAELELNPPAGAHSADIELLYQPTSWEYIQFLDLANNGNSGFLGAEGANMLEAWAMTGMAEPFVMTSATWGAPGGGCTLAAPVLLSAEPAHQRVSLIWSAVTGADRYGLYYDQADKSQLLTATASTDHVDSGLTNGQTYCYKVAARELAEEGSVACQSAFSNVLCATPEDAGHTLTAGATPYETGHWVTSGRSRNVYPIYEPTGSFAQGEEIIIRLQVTDDSGAPLANAQIALAVSGPQTVSLLSTLSNADGLAEAAWATHEPDKKGQGGTPTGDYTATVSGLNSTTHAWDGVAASIDFSITP